MKWLSINTKNVIVKSTNLKLQLSRISMSNIYNFTGGFDFKQANHQAKNEDKKEKLVLFNITPTFLSILSF